MVFGVAEVLHGDKRYLSMPDKAFWWTPVFAGLVSSLPDTARLTLLGLRPLKIMFASLPRKMARKPQTKLLVPSFIPPSKWTNWRTQFNKIYCLRASLGQGEGFICIYIYIFVIWTEPFHNFRHLQTKNILHPTLEHAGSAQPFCSHWSRKQRLSERALAVAALGAWGVRLELL